MKLWAMFALAGMAGVLGGGRILSGPLEDLLPDAGTHGAWYASRAAGLAAYLCVWLGLAGGLLMSSAWFDGIIGRARLLAVHQTASLAGVVLGLAHGLVLMPDGWTDFGVADILVPFVSYYKPALSGLGTVSFYMFAIVTFSFWARGQIGVQTWKKVHYTAFVAYVAALWHGVRIGSDAGELWVLGIYIATSMTIVTGLVVRMTYTRPVRRKPAPPQVVTA